MSTFGGILDEYPLISIDRFEGYNYDCTVFFLSHCHSDHMIGLSNSEFHKILTERNDCKIYMSKVSKIILENDDRYRHLKPHLESIPIEQPVLIPVPNKREKTVSDVTVTLLPAGHCPGSVMFLFESSSGTVLYTGDFRIRKGQIKCFKHLHHPNGSVKSLSSLHLDTTFCDTASAHNIPTREESLDAIVKLVWNWIKRGPQYIVYLICPANIGYEYVFVTLYKRLNFQVHIEEKKMPKYNSIPHVRQSVTTSPRVTQIHACCRNSVAETYGIDNETPCGFHTLDKVPIKVRRLKLSAMFFVYGFTDKSLADKISYSKLRRVCFCTHPSMSELFDIVSYLKPKTLHANVVHNNKTEAEVLKPLLNALNRAQKNQESIDSFQMPTLGVLKRDVNTPSDSSTGETNYAVENTSSLDFEYKVDASVFKSKPKKDVSQSSKYEGSIHSCGDCDSVSSESEHTISVSLEPERTKSVSSDSESSDSEFVDSQRTNEKSSSEIELFFSDSDNESDSPDVENQSLISAEDTSLSQHSVPLWEYELLSSGESPPCVVETKVSQENVNCPLPVTIEPNFQNCAHTHDHLQSPGTAMRNLNCVTEVRQMKLQKPISSTTEISNISAEWNSLPSTFAAEVPETHPELQVETRDNSASLTDSEPNYGDATKKSKFRYNEDGSMIIGNAHDLIASCLNLDKSNRYSHRSFEEQICEQNQSNSADELLNSILGSDSSFCSAKTVHQVDHHSNPADDLLNCTLKTVNPPSSTEHFAFKTREHVVHDTNLGDRSLKLSNYSQTVMPSQSNKSHFAKTNERFARQSNSTDELSNSVLEMESQSLLDSLTSHHYVSHPTSNSVPITNDNGVTNRNNNLEKISSLDTDEELCDSSPSLICTYENHSFKSNLDDANKSVKNPAIKRKSYPSSDALFKNYTFSSNIKNRKSDGNQSVHTGANDDIVEFLIEVNKKKDIPLIILD